MSRESEELGGASLQQNKAKGWYDNNIGRKYSGVPMSEAKALPSSQGPTTGVKQSKALQVHMITGWCSAP